MENNYVIEQIKARITPIQYMEEHGFAVHQGRCRSFREGAKNPTSMSVDEAHWHDYATGKGGDVIDLVAEAECGGDLGQAIQKLSDRFGIVRNTEAGRKFAEYRNLLDTACDQYHRALRPIDIEYLTKRGIRKETIDALKIGYCPDKCVVPQGSNWQQAKNAGLFTMAGRLVFPYLKNGHCIYMAGRDRSGDPNAAKYKKLQRTDMSEHPIWGAESIRERAGTILTGEGIVDAISIWQEGFPVISAVTGQFSAQQMRELIPMLKGRRIVVCMDYDPVTKAGQGFTERLARTLFDHGIDVYVNFLQSPDGEKVDINEMYQRAPYRGTIQKVIDDAQPYAISQCERGSAEEVEQFLREICRHTAEEKLSAYFRAASRNEHCDKEFLKDLQRVLAKCPSELTICKEFKQKYDFVYQPNLGWYQWNGSVWQEHDEAIVIKLVGDLFGKFRTSGLATAAAKSLKGDLCREDLMDIRPTVINFPNGEYDVIAQAFTPDHHREYYSTVQMAYAYDANAQCVEFECFVESITNGSMDRMRFIQDMFAYCYFPDSRFQAAFCLVGSGANGKSVLLKVLEELVCEKNCTHVEISSLTENFQRIMLMNSQVNICNDMQSDVRGTESWLKAIVSGDPINGCRKGKDFINFKPRCKMVFSTNAMISAKVDRAYKRRLRFLDFEVSFVDAPDPNNHKQAKKDPRITERLLTELPGIFNWTMRAVQPMMAADCFLPGPDQPTYDKELTEMGNPVITFFEDRWKSEWTAGVARSVVVEAYNEWAKYNGSYALSPKSFWQKVKDIPEVIAITGEWRGPAGRMIRLRQVEQQVWQEPPPFVTGGAM